MFIELVLRLVLGGGRSRIRETFVSAFIVVALGSTALAPTSEKDYLDRPLYLYLFNQFSYAFRAATYSWIYFWILKHWERIQPLIDVNLADQLLFCLSSSWDVFVAYSEIWNAVEHGESVSRSLVKCTVYNVSYATLAVFGNASKILLCGVLRTVFKDVLTIVEKRELFGRICVAVRHHLATTNDLVVSPILALHVDYFIWSSACFACNLPAFDCDPETAIHIILETLSSTIPLLYILHSGILLGDHLRKFRRRAHRHFLETVSEWTGAKTWGPDCIIALDCSNLGITYDGVHTINRRNVTGYFGSCWSAGFVLFQIIVAYSRAHKTTFCLFALRQVSDCALDRRQNLF